MPTYTACVSVAISPELKARLTDMAQRYDMKPSSLCRVLLASAVDRMERANALPENEHATGGEPVA